MIFQKTIVLDFDGTITSCDKVSATDIPEPRKNAVAVINKWYDEGYIIIINTLRAGSDWEPAAREYLAKYGIKFHYFNENPHDRIDHFGDSRKISGDIYIDDRNMGGIPNDFADIDMIVKSSIGLPYLRMNSGWKVDPKEDKGNISMSMTRAMEMTINPFRAKFSSGFIEAIKKCPLGSTIYNQVFYGQMNEYEAIEYLYTELMKQNKINMQIMMNMPKSKIVN